MPSASPRSKPWTAAGALLLAVAAAGCAGATVPSPPPTASPAAPPPTARPPTTPPASQPSAPGESILLTGDAATNAACDLASVAEIRELGLGVKEMKGLTGPAAYGKQMLSCAWYLIGGEIGIPSVVVQWESEVTGFHDPVISVYRSMVESDLATAVDGIGDFAVVQGWTAEAISGEHIVRVAVLLHAEATPADQEDAVELLRTMLDRATAQ